jgi:hypothetical protein
MLIPVQNHPCQLPAWHGWVDERMDVSIGRSYVLIRIGHLTWDHTPLQSRRVVS